MSSAARILDAIFDVVADAGLERASVREVAAAAGVSIGTVQHHFPTKDRMLVAAFEEMVRRVTERVAAIAAGDDVRDNLGRAVRQLLPLDARRDREVRIQLAFAARAAFVPELAAVQARTLDGVRAAFAEAVAALRGTAVDASARRTAATLLATVDGLALHAVSAQPGPMDAAQARRATAAVDALLATLS